MLLRNLNKISWPPIYLRVNTSNPRLQQPSTTRWDNLDLIIIIAPGWPGMPWFWDLVQLSTEIPLQLPVSRTLLKQSHNYVFDSNPQHLNLHTWCLGVDNSKNKASLCGHRPQTSYSQNCFLASFGLRPCLGCKQSI